MKPRQKTVSYLNLLSLYDKLKEYLAEEQKELLFHKKSQQEEAEYFNFFKFIFESPDRKVGI